MHDVFYRKFLADSQSWECKFL